MNAIRLIIFLFLIAAFAIGVHLSEIGITSQEYADRLDATNVADFNLTIPQDADSATHGIYVVLQSYIKFILTFAIEVLKVAVDFGHRNPEYFSAPFLLKICMWIVILVIISILIKPAFYLGIIIVMFIIWIYDNIKKRKGRKLKDGIRMERAN